MPRNELCCEYTNLIQDKESVESDTCGKRKLKIEESFLRYFHVKDTTVDGLSTVIINSSQEVGVDINKCRAGRNLNLVTNNAIGSVRDVGNYFTTLQSLYVFFGHSINR